MIDKEITAIKLHCAEVAILLNSGQLNHSEGMSISIRDQLGVPHRTKPMYAY